MTTDSNLPRRAARETTDACSGEDVLIPALDCAATIEAVVGAAVRCGHRVLVVDDGSSDGTAERAAAAGAEVLRHPRNRGKGASLLRGMQVLRERGRRRVVTMDGDGQHLASEIRAMLRVADAHPGAIVLGERIIKRERVSALRLFGNRFANRWVEIACGAALPDTQSGFRVYPLATTLALGARAQRFGFETEVLIRAVRRRVPIRSQPVEVYYAPAAEHVSHYRPFVDTLRIIFVVLGLILWRR